MCVLLGRGLDSGRGCLCVGGLVCEEVWRGDCGDLDFWISGVKRSLVDFFFFFLTKKNSYTDEGGDKLRNIYVYGNYIRGGTPADCVYCC